MKRKVTKQSVMKGAMILAIASVLSKIIGMLYTIPLTQTLGDEGNAIYGDAFNVYIILITISAVGVPSAISKLVSERVAVGAYKDANRVFKIAMAYTGILGVVLSLVLWFGAEQISLLMTDSTLRTMPLKALAPTVVVVSLMAVIRGYFQGMNTMTPTAISQVIEQIFNAAFSIILANMLIKNGIQAAATGSTLGTGIGAVAGFLVLFFVYYRMQPGIKRKIRRSAEYEYQSSRQILKIILVTVIPIVVSTCIFSIMTTIDTTMLYYWLPDSLNKLQQKDMLDILTVTNLDPYYTSEMGYTMIQGSLDTVKMHMWQPDVVAILKNQDPIHLAGLTEIHLLKTESLTNAIVGQFTGKYLKLINVPVALILTMSMAATPAIAAAMARGEVKDARRKIKMILRVGMLIGAPAAVGLTVFGIPIVKLLYRDVSDGGELLVLGSAVIIFITIAQLTTGALQGMGKQHIPTINAAIACGIKVILNIFLLKIPSLHIYGVVISTTICYIIFAWLNIRYLKQTIHIKFNWRILLVKPVICSAVMGGVSYAGYKLLSMLFGSQNLALLLIIPIAVGVYGLVGLATGTITKSAIAYFPGGKRLLNKLQ
ncbi:MAG: putative polysaccharide biosynthesis protein [Cellulosilyticaceae bacterium]